jgi:hypothetical protein
LTQIPLVRPEEKARAAGPFALPPAVTYAALAAGLIFLIGSLVDVGTLWIGQRQEGPQWEFVAVGSTLEAFPRFALALALVGLGLHSRVLLGTIASKLVPVGMIVFAFLAGVLGVLMGMDYLALRAEVLPEAAQVFRSTAMKSVSLSALYVVALMLFGILGLRSAGTR